jgi:hypothetical protein
MLAMTQQAVNEYPQLEDILKDYAEFTPSMSQRLADYPEVEDYIAAKEKEYAAKEKKKESSGKSDGKKEKAGSF